MSFLWCEKNIWCESMKSCLSLFNFLYPFMCSLCILTVYWNFNDYFQVCVSHRNQICMMNGHGRSATALIHKGGTTSYNELQESNKAGKSKMLNQAIENYTKKYSYNSNRQMWRPTFRL